MRAAEGARAAHPRRVHAVVLVVALAAVGVGAPVPAVADASAPGCTRLAVIGDSLTVGSAVALASNLAASGIRDLAIDARASRQIRATAKYSGVRALRDLRAQGFDADCYVVALGTNDVMITASVAKYGTFVTEMLAEVGDHPVLWVDVANGRFPARATAFDQILVDSAVTHPNLLVAAWSTVIAANPAWTTGDKIHLRRAGSTARAAWLADQVVTRLYGSPPDADPPGCTVTRRLRLRVRHPEVVCLEARLVELGYPSAGPPDERFDAATYRALASFQRRRGLAPSGIATATTVDLLGLAPGGGS